MGWIMIERLGFTIPSNMPKSTGASHSAWIDLLFSGCVIIEVEQIGFLLKGQKVAAFLTSSNEG